MSSFDSFIHQTVVEQLHPALCPPHLGAAEVSGSALALEGSVVGGVYRHMDMWRGWITGSSPTSCLAAQDHWMVCGQADEGGPGVRVDEVREVPTSQVLTS